MKTWTVYWSPEGRPICLVQANTERQAIRKAPQPYRKYLGEMYAVEGDYFTDSGRQAYRVRREQGLEQ
jgi:hypothetical protein